MTEDVTVSSKYQIVIPKAFREEFGIKPGDKLVMSEVNGMMTFVPRYSFEDLRGILKGVPHEPFVRDKTERVIDGPDPR